MAHAHSLSLINGLMVLKVCHTGFAISKLLLAFCLSKNGAHRVGDGVASLLLVFFCFQFVGLRNWAHRVDDVGEL